MNYTVNMNYTVTVSFQILTCNPFMIILPSHRMVYIRGGHLDEPQVVT